MEVRVTCGISNIPWLWRYKLVVIHAVFAGHLHVCVCKDMLALLSQHCLWVAPDSVASLRNVVLAGFNTEVPHFCQHLQRINSET
jgi:hypothetical protein